MITTNTMKTIFLTTLVVLALVGGLLWIADQTKLAPKSNQAEWDAAYDVIVNSEYSGRVFPGQTIEIEIEVRPPIKSMSEAFNDISASAERTFSEGIWSNHRCDW